MRAIIFRKSLPIENPDSLLDVNIEQPVASGRDLLIKVNAISVNPVDVKIRQNSGQKENQECILGWDAAGTVMGTGSDVKNFSTDDEVFYAGSLTRPGTNAEYHLVDERLVGRKPHTLNWAESAALPLTALTAWEMLFDRLQINQHPLYQHKSNEKSSLLIIGGAGGVATMAIQLARAFSNVNIIATASRPETKSWVESFGAHYVIDHSKPLAPQIAALPVKAPKFVFSTNETLQHMNDILELIEPEGQLGLIDDPEKLDVVPLKKKSLSLHWEMMFTRSLFQTDDMAEQGEILNKVSQLVDTGILRTTLGVHLGSINAANLKRAHSLIETGKAKGKIVLENFEP